MDEYGLFYRNWKGKIFNYLTRLSGNHSLAGEIMQETFTRHLAHYGEANRDIPLLYRIARNLFMDEMRETSKLHEAGETKGQEPSIDQDHYLMIRSEYRRVLEVMKFLNADEREILALVVGEDLSYREIADILGISEMNVKVKVHRARLNLREKLKEGNG